MDLMETKCGTEMAMMMGLRRERMLEIERAQW